MRKAFAAARSEDRERLLGELRRLGVLHLVPVEAGTAAGSENEGRELERMDAALSLLRALEPRGDRPSLPPSAAVDEALEIRSRFDEGRARLDALHREARRLGLWRGIRLARLRALESAGVDLRLYVAPGEAADLIRGTVVQPLRRLDEHRRLVAVIGVDPASVPTTAREVPRPLRDREQIERETEERERAIERDRHRLEELALLVPELERERTRLEERREWSRAVRGGWSDGELFAVQGWVPAERSDTLGEALSAAGIPAAVHLEEPGLGDAPPTLVRRPRWARPVGGMFRALSLVPGYEEADLSAPFMIALPVFAGMIIGDAGYGLLFLLFPLLLRRRLAPRLGTDTLRMLSAFGLAALAWGTVNGVWFGFTPLEIGRVEALAPLGAALDALRLVRGDAKAARLLLMKVCFMLGSAHLITAHLWRAAIFWPDARAAAEVGWCLVLLAALGLIWILFFGGLEPLPGWLAPAVVVSLVGGLVLVIGFSVPDRRAAARIGLGAAGALLPLIGAFGDTLSYIRLMAIGLASFYLGSTFNSLAGSVADAGWWPVAGAVFLFGHTLNLGLILIAIFAHGMRLNVLEFSSHAGVRWAGHPYEPFAARTFEEHG